MGLALALALLAGAREVPGQTPPDAQRVVSVRVEPLLENENPWVRLGISPGDAFSPARAREALRRALASGTFAEASIAASAVPGGVEVVLRGERRYRLQVVTLAGVSARPFDAVTTDLALRNGTYVTDSLVSDALRRVEQGYRDAGWESAHASATWRETDAPGVRVLVVGIQEGVPTRVGRVVLVGIAPEVDGAVRRALEIAPGDVANPATARLSADAVSQAMHHGGWLAATVIPPHLVPVRAGVADLVVMVVPGDRYRLVWQGVRSFTARELTDALRLDEERGLDGGTLSALVGRVQDWYVRQGFPEVRVRGEVLPDGPGRKVLRFTVAEGAVAHVGTLRFPGAVHFSQQSLARDVQGLVASQLPAGSLAPSSGMDAYFDGEASSEVPRDRPHPPEWYDPERTYVPELYAEAARRIVARYHDAGYPDAVVAAPTVTRAVDVNRQPVLDVTFAVTEGPRSLLEEITFVGNAMVSSAELAQATGLELGVPLSYRAIEEARVRIADSYRERAYAFVRVDPEVERSPDSTRARVRFTLHEGPAVRVGTVIVRGNVRSAEAMVRQRLSVHEGDLYLLADVRISQRRLGELGVFSGVNVGLENPDIEAPVKNVVVQLAERRPQFFEPRVGFSTGEGIRAGFEYGYGNLLGRAVSFTLRARVGRLIEIPGITPSFTMPGLPTGATSTTSIPATDLLQWRIAPSLAFPYLPLLGPGFSATIDGTIDRTLTPPWFLITTNGGGLTLTNRSIQSLTLSLTGEIQDVDTTFFGSSTNDRDRFLQNFVGTCMASGDTMAACLALQQRFRLLLRNPSGEDLLGSLRLGLALDRRDNAFIPTRGFYVSLTTELLQVFSQSIPVAQLSNDTLHIVARVSGHLALPLGVVFTSSLRFGFNYQLASGTQTHPTRLFLLGGADTMRGWLQNSMYAQDVIDQLLAPTTTMATQQQLLYGVPGGEWFINWVNEFRIPTGICLGENFCLAVGIFADVGNLWGSLKTLEDPANLLRLRVSPGVGLRLTTPFGLLALDVGFNVQEWFSPALRDIVGEQPAALQFSLGSL